MGEGVMSKESYSAALREHGITGFKDVTKAAEQRAYETGHLSEIVDPAINPIRLSKIRVNPHRKKWIITVGCPMDIEVSCDTTGSMGSEVDTEMEILPNLYEAVTKVLPGYDPQLCLGIFGDVYADEFGLCRPQFEMEAMKIVHYLSEMAPQRNGGDEPEDPQYAMFARAYLTDAYTNRIGLKGYHFIVTDATCHNQLDRTGIEHVFGEQIFDNELKDMKRTPTVTETIKELKKKTHQFILVVRSSNATRFWCKQCGEKSVIKIDSTRQLPEVISAIIGLTEGTLDVTELKQHLGFKDSSALITQLSGIDIGAQARLRHALPHPVPKIGDIFLKKGDIWPIQPNEASDEDELMEVPDHIEYL